MSNPHPETKYASTSWSIGDVTSLFDVTEEQAHEFLVNNGNRIADSMITQGWVIIQCLGEMEGFTLTDSAGDFKTEPE